MTPKRRKLLLAAGLGLVVVLAAFGPLVSPHRALAGRDISTFHLPLRTAFVHLAAEGSPTWNPWLHGGQPILSNPNYGAFYPPSWLAFLVGPIYALGLLVLLHGGLAFAGSWVLARRLGCGSAAAAMAAVGFTLGGAFLSLTASLTVLFGIAWAPWVLAGTERMLSAEQGAPRFGNKGWLTAAVGGGAALAAILIAGDPSGAVVVGCGILAFSTPTALHRPRRLVRLPALFAVTLLLAAIQWLPTWQRLADSPRSGPLPIETATRWSTPPLRLIEVAFPRLWGDPSRINEGLFFGWTLHDRGYPYVISIYPGLLVTLVGVSALLRGPLPRRSAWLAALGVGVFLALGRHNPVYPWLHEYLPILGRTRYPEKFLLLATSVLPFVAALGWQRLMTERRQGRHKAVDLTLGLAVVVLVAHLGLAVLARHPAAVDTLIRAGSPLPPSERQIESGGEYLGREAWLGVGVAAAGVLVLGLYRRSTVPVGLVGVLAVGCLGADLWLHNHRLVATVPSDLYRNPPPLADEIAPGGPAERRIFWLPPPRDDLPDFVLRPPETPPTEPLQEHVEQDLQRLDPLSALLWGIGHAFPPDYDLMLTGQAIRNRQVLDSHWETEDRGLRVLGAWSVGHVVSHRSIRERVEAALRSQELEPAVWLANPYRLPPFRFVPEVVLHPDPGQALEAATQSGYEVYGTDHWIDPGAHETSPPRTLPRTPEPELVSVEERGGEIEIVYRAPTESYLVAAVTWDPGWSARIEGSSVEPPLFATALGQIGCRVPAGEHGLRLTYRDPWIAVGAAVSGLSAVSFLLVGAIVGIRRHRIPSIS